MPEQAESSGSATTAAKPSSGRAGFLSDLRADVTANVGARPGVFRHLLIHPGLQLLLLHRLEVRLRRFGAAGKACGKCLWKLATILTACQIDPTARLEGGIGLPHATGIVIGGNSVLESGAVVYQNVTLGRQHPHRDEAPRVRAGAVIGAGAKVLGNVVVGAEAHVGANAVVIADVPDRALAVGVPARVVSAR